MKKKKIKTAIMIFLAMGMMLIVGVSKYVDAASIGGIITKATLSDSDGNPIQDANQYTNIQLNIDFSLPNNQVHEGDTSIIKIPDEMKFVNNMDFQIKDSNGNTIANAHVDANTKEITLTFTNYAESHSNVTGSLFATIRVDTEKVKENKNIPIVLDNNNINVPAGSIKYGKVGDDPNERFWKYGWFTNDAGTERQYGLRVNGSGQSYPQVVVTDKLQSDGAYYDEGSFTISKGKWVINSNGLFELDNSVDVTAQYPVVFDGDHRGFQVIFGDINGEGYIISYRTKNDYAAANGEIFKNDANLMSEQNQVQFLENQLVYQSAGGVGDGYNYSINIEKEDENGNRLTGAEFDVIRDATNKSVGKIITDSEGKGSLGGLLKDDYTIKESKAPDGYLTNTTPIKIGENDFNSTKKYTLKVVNKKIPKIDITGIKQWVDGNNVNRPTSITVNLLADGTIIDTKQVSASDNWQFSFDSLLKYDAVDGHEIEYTITENVVSGYSTGFSGTAEDGFTITNTINGKVSIPVTKIWEGPAKNSVNVHLLANGQEVASQILNEANNWQYTFIDFDEYDNNGVAIDYTIKEDEILNYSTVITGDVPSGYTITNTNEEKIDVKGNKQWIDNNNPLRPVSITINLFADGEQIATKQVNASDNWQFNFSGLPKYDRNDAHEIIYSIKEVSVPNYSSVMLGTVENGFIITNTIEGKISIPITKIWKGSSKKSVNIRLYANGVEVANKILSNANNWQGTFSNLAEYKNGKKINYTVKEDTIVGYRIEVTGNMNKGYVITNIAANKTSIPIKKIWYGTIQKEVKINLLKDNQKIASLTLNKHNNWQGIFKELPKFESGKEVKYTVAEERISGYIVKVTGDSKKGYVITNTQTIPKSGSIAINLFLSGLLCGIIGILALSAVKNKY